MPPVSSRGQALPPSPIRKLAPFADAAKARGVKVFHLNIGQPDLETPKVMRERLRDIDPVIAYSPSNGTPQYLEALSRYYAGVGLKVEPRHLIATTGGSEALFFAFLCLAEAGDEAIVAEPFYTNYSSFAAMTGVKLVPVRSRGEDGFHLPAREAFEKARSPRTRFVLLCNPSNPTGTVYTREEVERVAGFCREHDLFLVSDEVYREFTYDGKTSRSVLTLEGMDELAIVVDSVSKRYSLCGARIGNIVSRNREFMSAILRFGQARLCPPTIEQFACTALTDVPASYTQGVIAEYQKRRDCVYGALSNMSGVRVRKPEGAFYVCLGLPVDDANAFAIFLLSEFSLDGETVMVAPLDGFYATPGLGRDEVRLAYVLEVPKLERSMRILEQALAAYRAKVGA